MNYQSGFRTQTMTACCLLWLAFPPFSWWPLAFLSIAIFIPIITRVEGLTAKEYRWLWYCSSLLWLALLQGIRLAYWPLYGGWLALGLYCGVYIPLWVGVCRKLIHAWEIPWQIVIPSVWVSCELFRGYFVTGFSACLLGHTVVEQPVLLQIASHLGGYGVSAMVVISAGLFYQLWLLSRRVIPVNKRLFCAELSCSIILVVVWIGYGLQAVKSPHEKDPLAKPLLTAALIQENSPTMFEANPDRNARSWQSYMELTKATQKSNPNLDLIIWPESVFTADNPIIDLSADFELPSDLIKQGFNKEEIKSRSREYSLGFRMKTELVQQTVAPKAPHLIVGNDLIQIHSDKMERLNAAIWIDRNGNRAGYYAKRHLVMFGEYIPLGDLLPIIYSTLGMVPASAGDSAKTFDLGQNVLLAPTICFENVLPHLNRRAIVEAKAAGNDPTLMINLTNDGWFRGSSILDHHLSCATLACVENRRPMLIAANTGLSAWIDGSGRRMAVTKRLAADTIVATPYRDSRGGLWQTVGDRPWWILSATCWTLWVWRKKP